MDWNDTEEENFTDYFKEGIEDDIFARTGLLTLVHMALFVICVILIICGFFENFLVCWILIRTKKCFKSFSNFHLLNLAVADLLFRTVSNPDRFIQTPIGVSDVRCKVVEFGKYATLAVTFCLLAGIAYDRYMHIVHPFKARRITWKHSRNVVVASWIYGAACSAPFLYSSKSVTTMIAETEEKFSSCYYVSDLAFQISLTIFLSCSFIIPLVFMGFAYGKILLFLWKRARSKLINSKIARAKFRAVQMMLLIVFAYVITWGPQLIMQTIDAFEIFEELTPVEETEYSMEEDFEGTVEKDRGNSSLQILQFDTTELYFLLYGIFDTLTFASSVLNPLIFGYYNRTFRDEFRKFCCTTKPCGLCFAKRKQEVKPCVDKRGIQATETDLETTRL